MRVLFTTFPIPSHLHLLAPLAWALRAAGHEVRVAGQPETARAIQQAGLTAVPVGAELDFAARHAEVSFEDTVYASGFDIAEQRPEVLTPRYLRGLFTTYIHAPLALDALMPDALLRDLAAFTRWWRPDLVVWDALTYAGPVVAKATGTAHARLLSGVDNLARLRALLLDSPDAPEVTGDPVADWLGGKLARFGCDFDEQAVVGQLTIDPLPSWMSPDLDLVRLPMRPVPYHGPSAVPDWLREPPARTRVCLTLGMSGRSQVRDGSHVPGMAAYDLPVEDLLEAVSTLDAEVVATLTADQLGRVPVPANVRLVDFVPLDALLPTCSAIVHHGGAGTMNTALVHAVPQLVVPTAIWDERQLAAALAEQGAGITCLPEELGPRLLREQLGRLVDEPSFAANAGRLAEEVAATPSPHDIVPALEELVAVGHWTGAATRTAPV
ncbi:activator-dependent family glycosyltransferase [Saccharopolyspora erythraea]|uniref:activator-dependent family glycosyltransferase n=1 Tax=Saccharopolyspora erythraea TaxID=1836 RepID=UPI001BA48A7E|nr:activator-dependent family glycosyltransferase [Saccharopolyspora erythraea]QUH03066.1 activator-dependent family glycosyltransferase [Saccharopolyspora erythraea]